MIELDKQLKQEQLYEYREKELKTQKMGVLETKIDKFLSARGIKYHRQFPIVIGMSKPKRYAVSFFLPKYGVALDMVDDDFDSFLYEPIRFRRVPFHPYYKVKMIGPINKNLPWVQVKKDLTTLLNVMK